MTRTTGRNTSGGLVRKRNRGRAAGGRRRTRRGRRRARGRARSGSGAGSHDGGSGRHPARRLGLEGEVGADGGGVLLQADQVKGAARVVGDLEVGAHAAGGVGGDVLDVAAVPEDAKGRLGGRPLPVSRTVVAGGAALGLIEIWPWGVAAGTGVGVGSAERSAWGWAVAWAGARCRRVAGSGSRGMARRRSRGVARRRSWGVARRWSRRRLDGGGRRRGRGQRDCGLEAEERDEGAQDDQAPPYHSGWNGNRDSTQLGNRAGRSVARFGQVGRHVGTVGGRPARRRRCGAGPRSRGFRRRPARRREGRGGVGGAGGT